MTKNAFLVEFARRQILPTPRGLQISFARELVKSDKMFDRETLESYFGAMYCPNNGHTIEATLGSVKEMSGQEPKEDSCGFGYK